MTETYGWFCIRCGLRYRASLCKGDKCPSGHDLNKWGIWIYKKDAGWGTTVRISYQDKFRLEVYIPPAREIGIGEYAIADAIHNAIHGRSLTDRDWRIKCSVCKHYGSQHKFSCAKGHNWKTIFCEDFERRWY